MTSKINLSNTFLVPLDLIPPPCFFIKQNPIWTSEGPGGPSEGREQEISEKTLLLTPCFLPLQLRKFRETDPKLAEDKPRENRTKDPAESTENVIVLLQRRHKVDRGLNGVAVVVLVVGH